jgi:hypothetical protein
LLNEPKSESAPIIQQETIPTLKTLNEENPSIKKPKTASGGLLRLNSEALIQLKASKQETDTTEMIKSNKQPQLLAESVDSTHLKMLFDPNNPTKPIYVADMKYSSVSPHQQNRREIANLSAKWVFNFLNFEFLNKLKLFV